MLHTAEALLYEAVLYEATEGVVSRGGDVGVGGSIERCCRTAVSVHFLLVCCYSTTAVRSNTTRALPPPFPPDTPTHTCTHEHANICSATPKLSKPEHYRPQIALRHGGTHPQGPCPPQPRDPSLQVPHQDLHLGGIKTDGLVGLIFSDKNGRPAEFLLLRRRRCGRRRGAAVEEEAEAARIGSFCRA